MDSLARVAALLIDAISVTYLAVLQTPSQHMGVFPSLTVQYSFKNCTLNDTFCKDIKRVMAA
jgi:hypothetical protein